jgi:predicted amidohydrolase
MNLKVRVAQFPISLDLDENLSVILRYLKETEPDELLVLPEGALSGYDDDVSFLEILNPEAIADAREVLKREAVESGVHLVFGSCIPEEGRWYNAGLYYGPDSEEFVYRKVNLATHERGHFAAGSRLPVFKIETEEGPVRVAIQLCRELRYPEQWRYLAQSGAQVILYLTNAVGDDSVLPVWRSHLVSRAAENQRFVLSANNAHAEQKCPTLIAAPSGEVLREIISDKEESARCVLDLSRVSDWYLDQARSDVLELSYQPSAVSSQL